MGAALAIPDYLLGVTLHESTHALAAKLVGADVDELHVFPPGRDPHAHVFRFGWTYVHGLRGRPTRACSSCSAPKLMDSLLLGGLAAVAYTGAWPGDRYAQVALTVAGTGLVWVDFSKRSAAAVALRPTSRSRSTCLVHARLARRSSARLLYASVAAGWAVVVVHEYRRTFESPPSTPAPASAVLPVATLAF